MKLLAAFCFCLLSTAALANCGYDQYGRQFCCETRPGFGVTDPLSPVQPDVFGPGIGMDQYGRPMQAVPVQPVWPTQPRSPQQSGFPR